MSRRVEVTVDVDLSEIDDDDLIEEMASRKLIGAEAEIPDLAWVHRAISEDRKADALALIERLMRPKFNSLADCMKAQRVQSNWLFFNGKRQ
jgi:hypothetical protein